MKSLTQIEVLLPELRAYARSICELPEDAEDCVQDAIERCIRTDSSPNKLSDLRPWMFRVIRSIHHDELRSLRVRREYFTSEKRLSSERNGVPDHSRDVLLRIEYENLPAEKREIVFLVDIMGLSYAEAANIMGVPTGTVMSRISRARSALRAALESGISAGSTTTNRNKSG